MLGALIIVFREVIEAGLIIGIVMAVTQNVRGARSWIAGGVLAGIVGAGLVAAFADALSSGLAGRGQEVFNASVLGLAVIMLSWHNIWMARHGREMAQSLSATGQAVAAGEKSLIALAVVVGLAVLREGAEVVLFLYGVLVSGETTLNLLAGGVAGLALGALVSIATFKGLVTIPPRHLFGVTTTLITFLAAGLAAQSVGFLQQAWIVTALTQTAWDTSAVLSDASLFGRVLHTLIGYTDQPSVMQVLVYVATLVAILVATRLAAPRRRQAAPVEAPAE
jgi:high-affinity iron transporter